MVEQRSGRDITRAVLLQVISEQEQGDGARLSVVLGEAFGATSPVALTSPMFLVDVTLEPGATLLSSEVVGAPAEIARALQIEPGAPVAR